MSTDVFIHQLSDVQTENIGNGTKIWQFCVVLKDAVIGKNVNICSHCFIENEVQIGDDVTVKNGVYLYDGITLGNRVFIGPNVTFTNDKYPRSKRWPDSFPRTVVGDGASIGGGAVILPGVRIGKDAMVGAGAVVTKDVPDGGVLYGGAAKLR